MKRKTKIINSIRHNCPICGSLLVLEDNEKDVIELHKKATQICINCGWIFDLEQEKDFDLFNKNNKLSVNVYKREYCSKIDLDPKYRYLDKMQTSNKKHACPVCGEYYFPYENSLRICPVCGWQDESVYSGGGANELSLKESIKQFKKT